VDVRYAPVVAGDLNVRRLALPAGGIIRRRERQRRQRKSKRRTAQRQLHFAALATSCA
jgi:hypothetical protein